MEPGNENLNKEKENIENSPETAENAADAEEIQADGTASEEINETNEENGENEKKNPDEVTFEDVLRAAEKKAREEEAQREAQAQAEEEARQKLEEARSKDPDLKEAEEKAEMYKDKYLRTLAEFDNFRNRTIKEKALMYDDGVISAVEKLLPVADNLERAVQAAADENDPLLKGVQMTLSQLAEIFKSMGVEEIPALGEKFDPTWHAAVAHEENEEAGEGEITMVLQKGYKYKDRVIRPSMVKVAN